jgi:hypothetical protein
MIGCGLSEVLAWHLAGKIDENHETHQDSSSVGRELNHGPFELKAGVPPSWCKPFALVVVLQVILSYCQRHDWQLAGIGTWDHLACILVTKLTVSSWVW